MRVRVGLVDGEVMIGFKFEDEDKAQAFAYDTIRQMKDGELHVILVDMKETILDKTEMN